MAKSVTINIRVDPQIKAEAEAVFASSGLTLTEAINMFLHKSIMERGLPFEVKISQAPDNADTGTTTHEI